MDLEGKPTLISLRTQATLCSMVVEVFYCGDAFDLLDVNWTKPKDIIDHFVKSIELIIPVYIDFIYKL